MQQRKQILSCQKAQRHSPGYAAESGYEIAAQGRSRVFGVAMQGRLSPEEAVVEHSG
jgi:hypothetical protein